MRKADKTLKLIDLMIKKDGGAAFRQNLRELMPKMEDAYRGEEPPFRGHLGASQIGRECSRELWYTYRWATVPAFPSRILRLFNRGHLEEARFLALLKMLPVDLWFETESGGQFRFSDVDGHFGSALDGVVMGIPDLPAGVPAYTEFKTFGDKSFQKLILNGVKEDHPEHYAQMQVCMLKMELPFGLYMAVNKNTDELHAEIISLDKNLANGMLRKAHEIIYAEKPPRKINESPGWWKCRFCSHIGVCHKNQAPAINCRTCRHAYPTQTGTWECRIGMGAITSDEKYTGCENHAFNPFILTSAVGYNGESQDGR